MELLEPKITRHKRKPKPRVRYSPSDFERVRDNSRRTEVTRLPAAGNSKLVPNNCKTIGVFNQINFSLHKTG